MRKTRPCCSRSYSELVTSALLRLLELYSTEGIVPVREEFQRVAERDDEAGHPQVMSCRVSPGTITCKMVSLERGSRGRKEGRGK